MNAEEAIEILDKHLATRRAKAIIDPRDPFKVHPGQLAALDDLIGYTLPRAKIKEGCKYARWAELDGDDRTNLDPFYAARMWPDNVFRGVIFGQTKTIYMWLPFFD